MINNHESALRAAVEEYLDIRERQGDLIWTRTDAASKDVRARGRHVRAGWPDLTIVLRGGRALLVELKRPVGGKTRQKQRELLAAATAIGVAAVVCRSVAEVQAVVEGVIKCEQ